MWKSIKKNSYIEKKINLTYLKIIKVRILISCSIFYMYLWYGYFCVIYLYWKIKKFNVIKFILSLCGFYYISNQIKAQNKSQFSQSQKINLKEALTRLKATNITFIWDLKYGRNCKKNMCFSDLVKWKFVMFIFTKYKIKDYAKGKNHIEIIINEYD